MARLGGATVFALAAVAAAWWFVGQAQQGRPVPVLMYHNLTETPGDDVWAVDVREFERHLQSLQARGYRSILPSDLAAAVRWGRPLPKRPVIITFDDGLQSAMNLGEPLLAKYGFRAIVYVITDFPAAPGEPRKDYRGDPSLTWPEIEAMARRGTITVGSHSHTHSRNPASNSREAPLSGREIRMRADVPARDFCYPYGTHPPALVDAVREGGFATAMICEDEMAYFSRDMDLLRIPRISVYGGAHRYRVEAVAPTAGEGDDVVFEGRNDGLPIPVLPVLRIDGRTVAYEGPRLPRLGPEPQRWRWPRTAAGGSAVEKLSVELWDTHRVLRLYP